MKVRKHLPALLCSMFIASSAVALASVPAQSTHGPEQSAAQKKNKTETVTPCDDHDNGDTVVTNDCGHLGDASVTPAQGTSTTSTTITTDNHFEGSITGFDSNDKLVCGPNNKVNVTATGGTIELKGGSNLTLKVEALPGATNVTIKLPNDVTTVVGPGSNVVVNTPG